MASAADTAAGTAVSFCEVSERCGLVFLPFLASEVSVRCTRIRHQGGWRVCVDSLCFFRGWQPVWRMVLERIDPARIHPEFFTQGGLGAERGGHAVHPVYYPRAGVPGADAVQYRFLRPAIVVHAGDDSTGGLV